MDLSQLHVRDTRSTDLHLASGVRKACKTFSSIIVHIAGGYMASTLSEAMPAFDWSCVIQYQGEAVSQAWPLPTP